MKPMKMRWVTCMGLFALALSACAQGSPSQPAMEIEATVPVMEPPCGNGKYDKGLELCDCQNKATTGQCIALDLTCDMVKPGSQGMLLCNAKPACTLDMSKCIGGMALPGAGFSAAATGGGGTGR